MSVPEGTTLLELSETELTVSDAQADVRGRDVQDATGEKIGEVDDLLVDDEEARVRMLRVKHGGFLGIGADHFLVPVDAVASVTEDAVKIDRERSGLTDVPGYDPQLAEDPAYYGDIYGWWGYPAYWQAGYAAPTFPYYPPYYPH